MQLSDIERDAIGEILNISMGSAATAISSMLDKQVLITTPKVSVKAFDHLDYSVLEPAILVKITYVSGITGSNLMVFRQKDMQLILNQLMGIEGPPSEDFVFDELSMSAASEVMNQMMGASATALSDFLGKTINISTPTAVLLDDNLDLKSFSGYEGNDDIVSVMFDLTIDDIMHSEFACVMSIDLAKTLVGQFVKEESNHQEDYNIDAASTSDSNSAETTLSDEEIQKLFDQHGSDSMKDENINQKQTFSDQQSFGAGMPNQNIPSQDPGMAQQTPPGFVQPGQAFVPPYPYPPYPGYGYPGGCYPPPYGYPGMPTVPPAAPAVPPGQVIKDENIGAGKQGSINVQPVKFPNFAAQAAAQAAEPIAGGNMDLIMNVPLSVTVEIGKTKKKIKDILDFTQGTVIELDKQAGAPVDIVVNGQLIARGDVVVIEDNFGVRVTEILGIKDILPGNSGTK